MKQLVLALALVAALAVPAHAGSSTVSYTSAGSSPFRTTTDGSSNNIGQQTIWDSAAGANGLSVSAAGAAKMEGGGTAGSASGGVLTVQGVAAMTPIQATLAPSTPLKLNALSTTVTAIKAAAGTLFMLQCGNSNTAQGYVQIFNVASGSVSLGSTAPTLSVPIAAASTGGFALPNGMTFTTALSAAATTTATGSTALTTALDCNVAYN